MNTLTLATDGLLQASPLPAGGSIVVGRDPTVSVISVSTPVEIIVTDAAGVPLVDAGAAASIVGADTDLTLAQPDDTITLVDTGNEDVVLDCPCD